MLRMSTRNRRTGQTTVTERAPTAVRFSCDASKSLGPDRLHPTWGLACAIDHTVSGARRPDVIFVRPAVDFRVAVSSLLSRIPE
jgi:hypothetical protein